MPKYLDLEGLKLYDKKLKEYINWDSAYQKPEDGIPFEDLEASVQQSLNKADTALQVETDPTVPAWAKENTKPSYTASEVGAVPITRTVNGKELSSNIVLTASDVNALPSDTVIPSALSDLSDDSNHRTVTDADIENWNSKTSNIGTITGITMNGVSKGTSGVVDLGTVITTHQDISGKADKATTLAGYGITDANISNGTITLGNETITPLTSFTETDPTVPSWAKEANKPTYTASEIGAVPTTRTINGKALSSDVTLTASDINALPSTTFIPTKTSDITNDSGFITSADITDVYKYKGTKANYSELPTTNNVVGDVWNVTNAYNDYPEGTNFAWDGSTWDALGGSVDLSGYVPTSTTINGQALTSNIVLTANDVNALPSNTVIPDQLSDLSDDSTHRTVTDAEKSAWNNKYDKPQGGIAKTDLDSSVQDSLDLADSALQPEDIASELSNSNQPVSASAVYNAIVDEEEVISAALNNLNSRIENMVVEETDPTVPEWAKQATKPSYTASEVGAVSDSITVNGKSLSSDITLTAADVNAVPTSRTINGKSLSSNITLTAADVNALPASTTIPSKLSDLTNDAGYITSSDLADEVSQEDKPVTASAVYEYVTQIEKVIASALNDINTRLKALEDNAALFENGENN